MSEIFDRMNEQQENIKHLLKLSSKLLNCEFIQETLSMCLIEQEFRVTKLQRTFRSFRSFRCSATEWAISDLSDVSAANPAPGGLTQILRAA